MSDFSSFARAHGLELPDLYPTERIRRCGTVEHPRKKNGAFFYAGDRGWVQDWSTGGEVIWWDDPLKREPTQADRDEWARKRAAREAQQARMWSGGQARAEEMLKTAVLGEHDYLIRKNHKDVKGLVLPSRHLFVPMRSFVTGNLVGGQIIFWDGEARAWEKKYILGSQPKGAALRIGPDSNVTDIILCEGYATGLSINKALTQLRLTGSVLVCFNDSNMINIARLIKSSPARAYVFADNDASEAGQSAAQATGLPYCMSPEVGEDANDLHSRAGIFQVMNLLMDARKRAIKATA